MRNSGAVWVTCVVVALSVTPGLAAAAPSDSESDGRGISDLIAGPATTLTLEGGLVGMQSLLHFTPLQLWGALCREEKSCTPVDYFALPVGWETEKGAQSVAAAVSARLAQDPDAKVILSGHSQGGQVIYAALRDWSAHPADAPSRDSVVWVSFGNPERLLDYLDTVSDELLHSRERFRTRLRWDTYSHYPIHAEHIRAWRAGFENRASN